MRTPTLRPFVALALLLALWLVADSGDAAGAGRPIVVHAQPMPHGGDAAGVRVGRLRYRTILHLTSDSEDFGGFSGLSIAGRHVTAVSDQGHWLTAALEQDPRGTVTGLGSARMGRLCDDDGAPVAWERRDAEEIQHLPGHGYLVSFERHHRIVVYPESNNGTSAFDGVPRPFPFPPAIVLTQRNKGMEAVAVLPDGRLLTFAEDLRTIDNDIIGWIGHPRRGDWRYVTLEAEGNYLPTGATLLINQGCHQTSSGVENIQPRMGRCRQLERQLGRRVERVGIGSQQGCPHRHNIIADTRHALHFGSFTFVARVIQGGDLVVVAPGIGSVVGPG